MGLASGPPRLLAKANVQGLGFSLHNLQWVATAFARIFGFNSFTVLAPQAFMGIARRLME